MVTRSPKKPPSEAASRTEKLKLAAAHYFCRKNYGVHQEIGLDKRGVLRADILAMTIYGYMVICEVKQSVADFRADKKWSRYLDYSNKFYFVFPSDVWMKVKAMPMVLPPGIGVMVLSDDRGKMRVVRKAKHRELDEERLGSLVLRMAWRGAWLNRKNTPRIKAVFL